DFFGITTNVTVSGKVSLFNRWGNPMRELEFTTQPQVFEPLWDGTDTSEGVYFYQLELNSDTETYSYSGFVQLVR
ncbi:gliding motility-associated C-terminal domain-containing protein, partial [Wandonia haliotis]